MSGVELVFFNLSFWVWVCLSVFCLLVFILVCCFFLSFCWVIVLGFGFIIMVGFGVEVGVVFIRFEIEVCVDLCKCFFNIFIGGFL